MVRMLNKLDVTLAILHREVKSVIPSDEFGATRLFVTNEGRFRCLYPVPTD